MDKLEALEIVWKMLPVDATDLQKEVWQTVKHVVLITQSDNKTKCHGNIKLENLL